MHAPKARKDQLTVREVAEETLVYDLERHKAHCLNPTAAFIWRHCDGQTTIPELARLLREEFDIPKPEMVIRLALEQLSRRHLLVEAIARPSDAARMSRRDALKKLAVAAVVLPTVMTLTARRAHAGFHISRTLAGRGNACNVPDAPALCAKGLTCCNFVCVDSLSFSSDSSNCGSCGNACNPGQNCVNGVCVNPNPCPPGITPCPTGSCPSGLVCENGCCV